MNGMYIYALLRLDHLVTAYIAAEEKQKSISNEFLLLLLGSILGMWLTLSFNSVWVLKMLGIVIRDYINDYLSKATSHLPFSSRIPFDRSSQNNDEINIYLEEKKACTVFSLATIYKSMLGAFIFIFLLAYQNAYLKLNKNDGPLLEGNTQFILISIALSFGAFAANTINLFMRTVNALNPRPSYNKAD